jgi:carboxyl-terminal processing protease
MDIIRVLPKLEEHVKACAACKGYIIDLRGNPGGIAVMANAISGWFVKDEGMKLGTMYQRDVELNFAVIPRLEAFTGPLAIIVDGASASTSEILAGGLQDAKRARIFGTRTAGAALPSVLEVLPTGDLFQFAIANYVSANGKELEGNGVTPDVIISHNRASLLKGQDAMLNAAANWIESPKPSARR